MNITQLISETLIPGRKSKYTIGNYELELPPRFTLPKNQKYHKLYDRFLPVLAKHLQGNKIIIDVGANIGDTAIAMMQHCSNPILCIEPSDIFFPYLENNLRRVSASDFFRVKVIKMFVGTGALSGELTHKESTATLSVNESAQIPTHIALDKLVEDVSEVLLVKVDTDGFDFDVLQSAKEILTQSEPILYWENEISEDYQYNGFIDLYSFLEKIGYSYIYIFDNFGNLITEELNFNTLKSLNSYVYSMKKSNCTRSIHYTDVLASTEKNRASVENAIAEYKLEWINK